MKRTIFLCAALCCLFSLSAQQVDFSKLNFACDGNSITAGNQWSKVVVDLLGFASHHNVAVGSSTFACHDDTQEYGSADFAGISGGWLPTEDKEELQKRHNNVAKVHIQKLLAEIESGQYPVPDVFVFAMGTNDRRLGNVDEVIAAPTLEQVDLTSMAGGARWAIQTVIENFPKCRVFLCTPIQTNSRHRNEELKKTCEVIHKLADFFAVQVIDCFNESGISEAFENTPQADGKKGRYLRDGLHPNEEGQQLMGRYIAKEIRNNYY